MAFVTGVFVLLGLVARPEAASCDREAPLLPRRVAVFVGLGEPWRGYSDTAEELRLAIRCYRHTFVVVDSPSEADVELRVLSRGHRTASCHPYHIGVAVVGKTVLPGTVIMAGQSWQDCAHGLALRIAEMILAPKGPAMGDLGTV